MMNAVFVLEMIHHVLTVLVLQMVMLMRMNVMFVMQMLLMTVSRIVQGLGVVPLLKMIVVHVAVMLLLMIQELLLMAHVLVKTLRALQKVTIVMVLV
jgi:hypothetical protein